MKLTPVITRARSTATYFSGRVFAAPDAAFALENIERFTLPCAFVVPASERAEQRSGVLGVTQRVEERCGVLVALANGASADLSLTAADAVDDARVSLRAALEGWTPATGYTPMQYASGEPLETNRQALWYAFEFASISTGTDVDGEGGAIVSYELRLQVQLLEGGVPATVTGLWATAVASATSGTRMASDLDAGLEAVAAGVTKFQLVASVVAAEDENDMNAVTQKMGVILRVHHGLSSAEDERDYTQATTSATVLPALVAMTKRSFWKVAGVESVIDEPEVAIPSGLTRT